MPVATAPQAHRLPRCARAVRLTGVVGALVSWAWAPPAAALSPEVALAESTVEVWGLRDGLNGSMVRSIAQTEDGYLWIAGFGGVVRYDGARLVRLAIEPPLDVMGMIPGPEGGVRIIARRGPIVCARRGTLGTCPAGTAQLTSQPRVFAIHHSPRGDVVVATDNGIFREKDGGFVLQANAAPVQFGEINAVHVDREGRLFVASDRGLFHEGKLGFAPFPEEAPEVAPGRSFFETPDGRLFILTDARILVFAGGRTETIAVPPELGVGARSPILEDRDGNLFVGGQNGLGRWRGGTFELTTKSGGLPDESISALFEDREGSLWVGTLSGGLAQFTDRTVPTKRGPPTLRDESIESVCEDPSGALWFGNRLGLLRWKDGVERLFTTADGLPSNRVYVAIPARAGGLHVGSDRGLTRFRDGRVERTVRFDGHIFSLYEDGQGVLWVGSDQGLARLEGNQIVRVPSEPGFDPGQIRGMAHDDRGVFWLSSAGGLGRLEGGRVVRVEPLVGEDFSEADRGITRARDGTLWIGVGASLVARRQGRFAQFIPQLGQSRDWLFQIQPDDRGHLWFGTSRTISRVVYPTTAEVDEVAASARPRVLSVISFDMTDTRREIAARRARNSGAWKTRDGKLWFATLRGVVTIDPTQVRTNQHPPPVLIERAVVDGRTFDGPSDFPPGSGNLEFHYAGVTLLEPRKAQHRYRLEGFDANWVEAGTRRVAYYTNIPPGKYRFRVQASNADALWNEHGAELALTLAPHIYQTAWFYGLCALAVGGMAFALYRARLGRLRGQYLAVFAERSRVARELHDSLLQGMSAVALELANIRSALPPTTANAQSRLEAVEDALTQSLEETRRFVWNLREQPSGAGDLGTALTRLAGRLTESRPEDRAISCEVTVQGSAVHLSHDAQGTFFRIAQEAITNALRHAEARTIKVELRYRDRDVQLHVSDDGRGFDPARAEGPEQQHFGIVGMHERARRMNGRLEIDSAPGSGTRITFTLPTAARRPADV